MRAFSRLKRALNVVQRVDARAFSVSSGANMRFVQFKPKAGGLQHLGAQIFADGDIFDISGVDSTMPNSLVTFLNYEDNMERAHRLVAQGRSVIPLKDVHLLSPITKPDKVVCVGLNFTGHLKELMVDEHPKEPMIFSKFSSSINGPNDDIIIPSISHSVDWEVELAVVMLRKAKAVRQDQAYDYILGYTVAQDISARDWQHERNHGQYLLGKTMDTFCPLGPAIVTKETLNPKDLQISCSVNGKMMQKARTSEFIFPIEFIIAYVSQIVTLFPGDVILMGTPAGIGMQRSPPEYLKPGDVLVSEIEGIGKMTNKIVGKTVYEARRN